MPTSKQKKEAERKKKNIHKKNGDEKHHHAAHRFGEELQSKKTLRTMIGSFLRKVKEKK